MKMPGYAVPEIPETFNISTYLLDRHLAEGRGEKQAVVAGERRLTYRQLLEETCRAANALTGLGLRREERVLLILDDCPEFLAGFLGAVRLGAVPVPVNFQVGAEEWAFYLNDSRARLAVVGEAMLPALLGVRERLRYLREIVVVGHAPAGTRSYQELTRAAAPWREPAETSRDEACYWLYSSGTTGQPKAAVHLQHDHLHCGLPYLAEMGIGEGDVLFSVPKLYFSYGLNNSLFLPLLAGATVVLLAGRPEPARVLETVRREGVTVLFSVPTSYLALLEAARAAGFRAPALRRCISAAEPLPRTLYDGWREQFGLEILEGCGSTEAGYIYLQNRPGRARVGSAGQPLPGFAVRLLDEEGKEAPAGQVGILALRGESTAPYYWNRHRLTCRTMQGEWLVTGDYFFCDAEGYYYHAGRANDMIKAAGIWVSPMEVELVLLQHPAVSAAGVVGVRDSDGLEKPWAFVVPAAGWQAGEELASELQEFVKARLARYKYPRRVMFLAELPATAVGKLDRRSLREMAAQVVGKG